jgi:hypothetical protein
MNPHVKEYVRCSSDETAGVDPLERITDRFRKEPEKPVDISDFLAHSPFYKIENWTQYDGIDSQNKQVAVPKPVNHRLSIQKKDQ